MKIVRRFTCALGLASMAAAMAGSAPAAPPSYDDYAAVLSRHVDPAGRVDYAALQKDRARLDAFTASLSGVAATDYATWAEPDRIAFWLNAYNALTLVLIVDHYPIRPATSRAAYPASSIRQIPGAWDQKKFRVMGREVTLDAIEHAVLRADFKEPRIHMALVCAALSCPPLRREPYRGATLDAQLDEQARNFLSQLTNFQIDREHNEVHVSRLFEWFADDFAPGATASNEAHVAHRKAVLAFAPRYLDDADRAWLEREPWTLSFFEYDWTLNERGK